MTTAIACAPVLPPCPATTGSNTASAVTSAIVSSKMPTTAAARKAVARLMTSHGSRLRTTTSTGESAFSSRPAPTIFCMSASASACTARSAASWRITPSSSPASLMTGSASNRRCCIFSVTSSRVASTWIVATSRIASSPTVCVGSARISARIVRTPVSRLSRSTT
jgi:hypothetical protein